jgi:hypothetical protein
MYVIIVHEPVKANIVLDKVPADFGQTSPAISA